MRLFVGRPLPLKGRRTERKNSQRNQELEGGHRQTRHRLEEPSQDIKTLRGTTKRVETTPITKTRSQKNLRGLSPIVEIQADLDKKVPADRPANHASDDGSRSKIRQPVDRHRNFHPHIKRVKHPHPALVVGKGYEALHAMILLPESSRVLVLEPDTACAPSRTVGAAGRTPLCGWPWISVRVPFALLHPVPSGSSSPFSGRDASLWPSLLTARHRSPLCPGQRRP